jgi:hypothetical protein
MILERIRSFLFNNQTMAKNWNRKQIQEEERNRSNDNRNKKRRINNNTGAVSKGGGIESRKRGQCKRQDRIREEAERRLCQSWVHVTEENESDSIR